LAQKQFRYPMPGTHQIAAAILTCPNQISGSFLLRTGNRDRHDLAQMQQPRQMRSITSIGFDPIT